MTTKLRSAAGTKTAADGAAAPAVSADMRRETARLAKAQERFEAARIELHAAKTLVKDLRAREKTGAGGQRKGG